jgi:hypothetical protein
MTTKIFSDDQLRDKDIDTLKRYLRYKLGGYRVALADIRTDNVLYRGVPWQQRLGTIDDVSYPPADRVTKLGRVNRIGKPVFYCSRAAPGVFYELRAKRGDLIALSEWRSPSPSGCTISGITKTHFGGLGHPTSPCVRDSLIQFRTNLRKTSD